MPTFKHLFSPIRIGQLSISNRVFMSPHGMVGLGIGTDAQVGYFEMRAKGGVGFMGIASCQVVPAPMVPPGWFIRAYDRDDIPAIRRIVEAVHRHGTKIFVQGVWMQADPSQAQASGGAPHTVLSDSQPRSMTVAEIKALVEAHVVAACHAREAGADGFEFPIGGGAGLQSFTSPLYNSRTDQYGGSLENRMRMVVEIVDGIRDRCGPDFAIGLAVNADDSTLGGDGIPEGVAMCQLLDRTGKADWLRITARGQKPQMTHYHYPSSYMGQGTHMYAAAEIRKAVSIPVVSGGRVLTGEFADQAIDEGKVDMVFVARALIADSQWTAKVRDGQTAEIRACIGDLEGCFMRSCLGQAVGCTVNPEIGREHEPPLPQTQRPRRVVVAGGGPAGMQAALIAAQRGHDVILLEASEALGGHVRLQAMLPGLEDRSDIVRWLALQLGKAGVDVRLNTRVTPELLRKLAAEAIIVATGANYARNGVSKNQLAPVHGADLGHVHTPEDLLFDHVRIGQRVVVYDNTSYEVGPGIAEWLADQGKEVTLVTIDSAMAMSVTEIGINKVIAARLLPKIAFVPTTAITEIEPADVLLRNIHTGVESRIAKVDNVVLVTSKPPNEALYHQLLDSGVEVMLVGDAREARWSVFATDEAIKDGYRAGAAV